MDSPIWTVLQCSGCGQCYGRKTGQKGRCTRCGVLASDTTKVMSHASNTTELQQEIALANMPDELRQEFREKFPSSNSEPVDDNDPRRLRKCLMKAAVDAVVDRDSVARELTRMNIDMAAEDLIEMGYAQGILIQLGEDEWQVLD